MSLMVEIFRFSPENVEILEFWLSVPTHSNLIWFLENDEFVNSLIEVTDPCPK